MERPHDRRRLRIGIDAHVLGRPTTGKERVMKNLLPAMREVCDHELFVYVGRATVAEAWRERGLVDTVIRHAHVERPLLRLGLTLSLACRRDRLDVLLCHYNRPLLAACPVATIVHDVSFARIPRSFSRYERVYMNAAIPMSMRRSAAVITDSKFSEGEIRELYGIPAGRIAVAPHGVDPGFGPGADAAEGGGADSPFVLAVGTPQPRKNMGTLIRAYARLIELHPEVRERLVLTGPELRLEGVGEEIARLRQAERLSFTGHVGDDELALLYRKATAFAYPSTYEGFGLPPLEALASGTPAVVADIPVMRELSGEAAVLVDPADVEAWADALWRLVSNPGARAEISARGIEHARQFTWERSARAVIGAVEAIARGPDRPHSGR